MSNHIELMRLAAEQDGAVVGWVKGLIKDVKTIATLAAGAMAVVGTVLAYVKTKSFAGTLTAAVLGAIVVFAVGSMDDLSAMVDDEVPEKPKGISVVQPYEPLDITVSRADLL
ncbi:complement resistance protein TraT [Streptomyces sp. NBC_00708]